MMITDYEWFVQLMRDRSREIAPDYPNIDSDLEPWEHLWAITASYEGTKLANEDLHKLVGFLATKLGITSQEAWKQYREPSKPAELGGVIGYLTPGIRGNRFECPDCATDRHCQVYRVNIGIYSQTCAVCNRLVVEGAQRADGTGPLILFDESRD